MCLGNQLLKLIYRVNVCTLLLCDVCFNLEFVNASLKSDSYLLEQLTLNCVALFNILFQFIDILQ